MKFLSDIRKQQQLSKLQAIEQEAEQLYTIDYFQRGLSYAYNGIPIIAIDPCTTAEQMVEKLQSLKQDYITKRKLQHERMKVAAIL